MDPDRADPSAVSRWTIRVDLRDVLFAIGLVLVAIGAVAVHWALAVVVVGLGLVGLALRLTR